MDIASLEAFEKCLDIFLTEKVVQAGDGCSNYTALEAEARGWGIRL